MITTIGAFEGGISPRFIAILSGVTQGKLSPTLVVKVSEACVLQRYLTCRFLFFPAELRQNEICFFVQMLNRA